jgi:hypothetical protein
VLAVQIPALEPRLQIVAVLPEAAMPAVEAGWTTALESMADGYAVRVMLRAETTFSSADLPPSPE